MYNIIGWLIDWCSFPSWHYSSSKVYITRYTIMCMEEVKNKPVMAFTSCTSSDSDCCAFVPTICGKLHKNSISRNYKITNKRLLVGMKVLMQKSSVAKHYGCKCMRHCGLIANGHGQADRDFSCVRNTVYMLLLHSLHSKHMYTPSSTGPPLSRMLSPCKELNVLADPEFVGGGYLWMSLLSVLGGSSFSSSGLQTSSSKNLKPSSLLMSMRSPVATSGGGDSDNVEDDGVLGGDSMGTQGLSK